MRLSRKFLNDYLNLDVTTLDIAEKMTKVGNEYDSITKLIPSTNLVVGLVKSCINHPDSDHLHVCKVDVGNELLNIVCGAPNVHEEIKVIVAKVGAVLPGVVIKKSTIRGVESEGMLCALDEIGLDNKYLDSKDKEGIYELPVDAPIGEDAIKYLELDDEIIDFDLTANRGDLLSILGMAYEIGAIYDKKVNLPSQHFSEINDHFTNDFKLEVDTNNCFSFLAKKVMNVKIGESPNFIKNRLIAEGIRPINNVVDISNYVMLETGQPLHFYDANLLGNKILVRMANDQEEIVTLDNNKHILTNEDIIITNGLKPIAIAGVMGGLETEITDQTTNIIIESAVFDPIKVRYTSKRILRSEASVRYEKGLDTNNSVLAINRCCYLLEKYAMGDVTKGLVQYQNETKLTHAKEIEIRLCDIQSLLGINIKQEECLDVFTRLGFTTTITSDLMLVHVPSRRLDINIKEDLIEEVGRIYGVDNIQGILPVTSIKMGTYNKKIRAIKNKLVNLGFNETATYSLIALNDVRKFTNDQFNEVSIKDPMNSNQTTLRYDLLSSLLSIYDYNKARGMKDISLFEIGKGFYHIDNHYYEDNKLALLMTGNYYNDIHQNKKVDFYTVKGIVEELLEYLGYNNRYSFDIMDIPSNFHPYQSANVMIDHQNVGIIGRIHPNLYKEDLYLVSINLDMLDKFKVSKMKYKEISKYPSISKDMAFILSNDIKASDVIACIKKAGGKLLKDIKIFDIYEGDKISNQQKSIAFNLVFNSFESTLKEEEVMQIFNKIIEEVKIKFNAILRDN